MANDAALESGAQQEAGNLPCHVAIIMDGNNRWAKQNQQQGLAGHRAGASAAREIVSACIAWGIPHLTLFAFSSENWSRPRREVRGLMELFIKVLQRDELRQFHEQGVRVRFVGSRERFSPRLRNLMEQAESRTANNSRLCVNVAADYGGRWDIAEGARRLAEKVADGRLRAADVSPETLAAELSLADTPMPDLCIRTGGEHRISNFLLWQFAYTELYFTDTYWPDFDDQAFAVALDDFARRQRRFGRTSKQVQS